MDRTMELLLRAQQGDRDAKEQLAMQNLGLVGSVGAMLFISIVLSAEVMGG